MKITVGRIKQIIKEEIDKFLRKEEEPPGQEIANTPDTEDALLEAEGFEKLPLDGEEPFVIEDPGDEKELEEKFTPDAPRPEVPGKPGGKKLTNREIAAQANDKNIAPRPGPNWTHNKRSGGGYTPGTYSSKDKSPPPDKKLLQKKITKEQLEKIIREQLTNVLKK